jgi:hypothetical protein
MDPIETLAKPNILEHLPIFLGLGAVIFGALYFIIRKVFALYNTAKEFIAHAVDEKMPASIVTALEDRAPAIFDKVVAERLAKHEEVEELKLEKALHALKEEFDIDREKRDEKIASSLADRTTTLDKGQAAIMEKLSGVDNRVQVVQLRLETHEARISAVEQVVRGPLKAASKRRKR